MMVVRKSVVAIYVDRARQRWIVRDPEGNFWALPSDDRDPWERREPFDAADGADLEPVPGHYKAMLGLPF
jgi:hypothetical protein